MIPEKITYQRGTAAGLLAVLFWSFSAPIVALAVGINPFLYIGLAHLIAFFVFLLKWIVQRENPLPVLRSAPPWFIAAGLVGIGGHEITWVAALQQAPPLEATLIIYTWPLLVIIFTTLILRQKFRWQHLVGGFAGLAGIVLLLMGRGMTLSHFTLLPGHIYAVISALTWALFSALCARFYQLSTNLLSLIFLLSSLINLSLWYFIAGAPLAPFTSIMIVAVSSVFITSGYMLWDFGVKHGNAPLIGVIAFLTPALAAFYLVLLGKAVLTPYLLASLALIITGIGIARYGDKIKASA